MGRGSLSHPVPLWLLTPLAFVAGLGTFIQVLNTTASLGFEYGASTATQTAVFACFMVGLGIGAAALGLTADSAKRPLLWAGLHQLALGCWWFAAPTFGATVISTGSLLTSGLALYLAIFHANGLRQLRFITFNELAQLGQQLSSLRGC